MSTATSTGTLLSIAFFRNKQDNQPRGERLAWEELRQILTQHTEREEKDGPLWSPTQYRAGATRGKEGVEYVTALTLDVDSGIGPGALIRRWQQWTYLIYSTYSSTLVHPKWRAVFPLARPVPAADWPGVYRRLVAALAGGYTDPSCKDCSRIYYRPSHPFAGAPFAFVDAHDGEWLDPETFPEPEPELRAPAPSRRERRAPAGGGDYSTLDVVAWFRAHGCYGGPQGGGKHSVRCPWEEAHTEQKTDPADDTDTVVWEADGIRLWPQFSCLHGHCVDRTITDVLELWADADRYCSTGWSPPRLAEQLALVGDPPPERAAAAVLAEGATPVTAAALAAGRNGDQLPDSERIPEASDVEEPPEEIYIDAGDHDLPRVAKAAWEALEKRNDPPIVFRYAGNVWRVEADEEGRPVLKPVTEDRMRHLLARAAVWFKRIPSPEDKNERIAVPALPPLYVCKDMLVAPQMPLPVLLGVTEAPVFCPDGTLHIQPGYHPGSRLYYAPTEELVVPQVSEAPTEDDVQRARALLLDELLVDFPFTGDAEQAHAVALLLLPFVRHLIDGHTPLHLIEKPSPGTGAGLLTEVLSLPAIGTNLAAMAEGRDEDEWRKRITAKLLAGSAVVLIDNLRRRLDSASVSIALTARVWEDRLLGLSQMARIPVRCAWVATGNNPAVSNEIARRTVRIRMDAKCDQPWLRKEFRHEDLRGWASEHRGELIWAALTLVRNWLARGKPAAKKRVRLGMFESWSDVMGGILETAGIPGFLGNLQEFYERADAEGAAWRLFVARWWERFEEQEVGVKDLWSLACGEGEPLLDLGKGSEQSQKVRLGQVLRELRDRRFGNVYVGDEPIGELLIKAGEKRKNAYLWYLQRAGDDGGGSESAVSLPGSGESAVSLDSPQLDGGALHENAPGVPLGESGESSIPPHACDRARMHTHAHAS